MKKLACLLVILSLGTFVVGCGGKEEKKDGKDESDKKKSGVNVDAGDQKPVNPEDIQLGGDKKNPITDGGDKKDPVDGGDKKDPVDGGDKKDPVDGGDKKDPVDGSDKKDPVDGGDKKEVQVPGPTLNDPVIDAPTIDPPKTDKQEAGDAVDKKDAGEAADGTGPAKDG